MDVIVDGRLDIICVVCWLFVKIFGKGIFDEFLIFFYFNRLVEVVFMVVFDFCEKICGMCN